MAARDADRRSYKTVAMPSTIRGGRRMGRTKAERVANAMAEIINNEADAGWTYLGSDTIRTEEKAGLFGGLREAVYTVLVFERADAGAPAQTAQTAAPAPEEPVRRRAASPAQSVRREPETARREPEAPLSHTTRSGATVRRQAADAAGLRENQRARGYGFDDDFTADREERPMRRREARVAARRASEDNWDDDATRPSSEEPRGRRGLIETMRHHRDRN